MKPTIVLFDLDGTLVDTGGAGRRAVEAAFGEVVDHASASALSFSFGGMTDRAIIRRGLQAADLLATSERIEDILARYLRHLGAELENGKASYRVLPGVVSLLDRLDAAENVAVAIGLGTGNIRDGARIKLQPAGLWSRFAFGGFGSDAEDRAELLSIGGSRGAALLGLAVDRCRTVVVGDTPRDVSAGKAIGAVCVAVCTGFSDPDVLRAAGPDHLFDDLATPGILGAILGEYPES